jgi:hypothetical protein
MARAKPRKHASPRKICETFLEFTAPLIEALGAEATDDQLENVLKIGFTVWNAVVIDATNPRRRFVEHMRKTIAHDAMIEMLVERLIERKHLLFRHDHRLIGNYQLYRDRGELRLRAEARRPHARS